LIESQEYLIEYLTEIIMTDYHLDLANHGLEYNTLTFTTYTAYTNYTIVSKHIQYFMSESNKYLRKIGTRCNL